jgi:hypothetical protein
LANQSALTSEDIATIVNPMIGELNFMVQVVMRNVGVHD